MPIIKPDFADKRIIGVILLALGVLISVTGYTVASKPAATPAETPVTVTTVKAELQNFSGHLSLTGIMDAREKSNLSAQLPGNVIAVNAEEGTPVKKGDTIISLDKRDLLNQLEQAKAGLANSQAQAEQARLNYKNSEDDYNRFLELYKADAISQQQMEQITLKRDIAKSQYETAKGPGLNAAHAVVTALNLNLEKMEIKSPIDGILASVNVSVGDAVAPGIPLASIVAIDQLALTGNLSEDSINYVKIGDSVDVLIDSIPKQTFTGKISYISPTSIPTGQFFPVKVLIDNPEEVLKAGMTATSKINVTIPSVIAIPNSALLSRDGKEYIMVVRDGQAIKISVLTGLKNTESTVILEGLNPGERIIAKELERVAEGAKVLESTGP